MAGPTQTPTHAAVLELEGEQAVVREAYAFLDEKRLLLAAELLRQLHSYRTLTQELDELHVHAKNALQAAMMHHGLEGLQVLPTASLDGTEFAQIKHNFMGVTLLETTLSTVDMADTQKTTSYPSARARQCLQLFHDIIVQSTILAGISGNLYRLLAEYRITERRSRALENVILPEIDQALRVMSTHLEELDLEDAIRAHLHSAVET